MAFKNDPPDKRRIEVYVPLPALEGMRADPMARPAFALKKTLSAPSDSPPPTTNIHKLEAAKTPRRTRPSAPETKKT